MSKRNGSLDPMDNPVKLFADLKKKLRENLSVLVFMILRTSNLASMELLFLHEKKTRKSPCVELPGGVRYIILGLSYERDQFWIWIKTGGGACKVSVRDARYILGLESKPRRVDLPLQFSAVSVGSTGRVS